mmetsp:Transcript_7654/g.22435  ORF Transcript_7654/g.22435 Transcript_7654/m.22435 type:complete len:257 (+) Transcript_7654:122-892(+)
MIKSTLESGISSAVGAVTPRPLNQVCCGCSLIVGVYFTFLVNALLNVFFIAATAEHLIWMNPNWSYSGGNATLEIWMAGLALAGMPVILMGLLGTLYQNEVMVRVYVYYLLVLWIGSLYWTVKQFMMEMSCADVPRILQGQGKSFSCGMLRFFNIFCAVLFVVVPMQLIFFVHSYADQLLFDTDANLSSILVEKNLRRSKRPWLERVHLNQNNDIIDRFASAAYGTVYDAPEGIGGSRPIFNGTYHETLYRGREGA